MNPIDIIFNVGMDWTNQSLTVKYGNTILAGKSGGRVTHLSAINIHSAENQCCIALLCDAAIVHYKHVCNLLLQL